MAKPRDSRTPATGPNLFGLMKPYAMQVALLVVLTVAANGLNLFVPKIIANGIDAYTGGHFAMTAFVLEFLLAAFGIFVYTSERVARDLRKTLAAKISVQEYASIQQLTPAKLLTNLTSDIDAIKNFVAQAIAAIISSVFLIIGASVLLIAIDWKLALAVLLIVPVVGGTFFFIFGRVRKLFKRSQEAIDWLNRVINESILGSALIRLFNAQQAEYAKFIAANTEAKDIGMSILRLFASLLPVITFATNAATLVILTLGGHFVITGRMSLGKALLPRLAPGGSNLLNSYD